MDGPKYKASFHLRVDPSDFEPAAAEEKESLVIMRKSVGFWKDGMTRLRRNKIAMASFAVILLFMIGAFVVPALYPYSIASW